METYVTASNQKLINLKAEPELWQQVDKSPYEAHKKVGSGCRTTDILEHDCIHIWEVWT